MPRRRKLFLAIYFLVCALLALVAAEVALRTLFGLGDPVIYQGAYSYRFAPAPHQRKIRRGKRVTIDSRGFRSVRDWSEPADLRVVFIGDSVTWGGTHVHDEETFAHIAGETLAELTQKRVTSANAGVNSYGTDSMAARIRHLGVGDEDAIVVTLIAFDTLRGLPDIYGQCLPTKPFPRPFPAICEVASYAMMVLAERMYLKKSILPLGREAREVAGKSLERLFAALREKEEAGKRVLLVYAPRASELGGKESEFTRYVRTLLSGSGLPLLDLHPVVSERFREGMFLDDVHLMPPGNRLYGETIAGRLLELFGKG